MTLFVPDKSILLVSNPPSGFSPVALSLQVI